MATDAGLGQGSLVVAACAGGLGVLPIESKVIVGEADVLPVALTLVTVLAILWKPLHLVVEDRGTCQVLCVAIDAGVVRVRALHLVTADATKQRDQRCCCSDREL